MTCESTMNTRNLELHSMTKFLTKERKKPKEIHERLNAVYGDVSPSYYQVQFDPSNLSGVENRQNYSR